MIEINLVPVHLRKKRKSQFLPGGLNIPLEVVIGLGGGVLILLIVAHVGLLFINMSQLGRHKKLQAKWEEMSPAKQNVDLVIKEMRAFQSKLKSIEAIMPKKEILWSQKLNILSDVLPRGVWLKRITLNQETLLIEGSAISRQSEEMINVHSFAANLKKENEFLEHFTEIDLGSIQRRKVQKIDIADFLITTRLKPFIEDEDQKDSADKSKALQKIK
ncbi:MAG TPA: hypothetical protein DD723_03560 [Candidatus Omnitrophica bacterium]|nr:MAG: hypothetical protein A2Z81_00715 [Omnitrophica WOR_2 bacterium GWA2_45_18]OGX19705.1 MAG: hypothetical protein A2Y04_01640 [Omnitrophica WOR_2 bacterium GWC2_45_7]HBR14608.1 hypothetical protein [Candidatus Omnitrophota bacterium]